MQPMNYHNSKVRKLREFAETLELSLRLWVLRSAVRRLLTVIAALSRFMILPSVACTFFICHSMMHCRQLQYKQNDQTTEFTFTVFTQTLSSHRKQCTPQQLKSDKAPHQWHYVLSNTTAITPESSTQHTVKLIWNSDCMQMNENTANMCSRTWWRCAQMLNSDTKNFICNQYGKNLAILKTKNIKICGWITKLEKIKMHFVCILFDICWICGKFEFLISMVV